MGFAVDYMLESVEGKYFLDPETEIVYQISDSSTDPSEVFTESGFRISNITHGRDELLSLEILLRLQECDVPEDLEE